MNSSPTLSLWSLVIDGGYIMIPLAILLLVTIYVFIERSIVIGRAAREDRTFMDRIREYAVMPSSRALAMGPASLMPQSTVRRTSQPLAASRSTPLAFSP